MHCELVGWLVVGRSGSMHVGGVFDLVGCEAGGLVLVQNPFLIAEVGGLVFVQHAV